MCEQTVSHKSILGIADYSHGPQMRSATRCQYLPHYETGRILLTTAHSRLVLWSGAHSGRWRFAGISAQDRFTLNFPFSRVYTIINLLNLNTLKLVPSILNRDGRHNLQHSRRLHTVKSSCTANCVNAGLVSDVSETVTVSVSIIRDISLSSIFI
jgi:hypothetical protein